MKNFLNYIRKNYQEIFLKIINSLDVEKVKQNIKENYNKIINDNDKVKNKMLNEFERILNIYKLNSELKDFCNILLSKQFRGENLWKITKLLYNQKNHTK